MNVQMIFILLVLLCCGSSQDRGGRGWRGILPLHSSRADVLEKLGPPNGAPVSEYNFEDVTVNFAYSSMPCDAGWNVPADTVLHFGVNIKKNRPKFSALNLDMSHYEKRNDIELLDIIYYENKKEGITYVIWNDEVRAIHYGPSVDDNNLKCK